MRHTIICAALLVSAATVKSHSSEPTPRALSLDECIKIALEHNLDVKIERYNPEIARYNLSLQYAGYDPAFTMGGSENFFSQSGGFNQQTGLDLPPRTSFRESYNAGLRGQTPIGLSYNLSSSLDRSSGNTFPGYQYRPSVSISLTQPLLKNFWIDSARWNISLNKKDLKKSELGLRYQIMTVVNNVQQAYYELIFSQENVKVQEEALFLAERALSESKKKVEVGSLAPLDQKDAESQVAASKANLIVAQQQFSAQKNVLKQVLSDEFSLWMDQDIVPADTLAAVPETFSRQDSWQKALTMRPDLLQMRTDLEKMDITLRYNRNQLFPELDLLGSYGRNALGTNLSDSLDGIREERNPFYSYGVTLSIPLSNRDARYRYKVSKAQKAQLLLQLKKKEQEIMIEIDDAIGNARSNYERLSASKEARLFAKEALDAEDKKLQNGKSTPIEVLRRQQTLTARRSDEIRALTDFYKSLASLAFDEGVTLEKAGVNVEVK